MDTHTCTRVHTHTRIHTQTCTHTHCLSLSLSLSLCLSLSHTQTHNHTRKHKNTRMHKNTHTRTTTLTGLCTAAFVTSRGTPLEPWPQPKYKTKSLTLNPIPNNPTHFHGTWYQSGYLFPWHSLYPTNSTKGPALPHPACSWESPAHREMHCNY